MTSCWAAKFCLNLTKYFHDKIYKQFFGLSAIRLATVISNLVMGDIKELSLNKQTIMLNLISMLYIHLIIIMIDQNLYLQNGIKLESKFYNFFNC